MSQKYRKSKKMQKKNHSMKKKSKFIIVTQYVGLKAQRVVWILSIKHKSMEKARIQKAEIEKKCLVNRD